MCVSIDHYNKFRLSLTNAITVNIHYKVIPNPLLSAPLARRRRQDSHRMVSETKLSKISADKLSMTAILCPDDNQGWIRHYSHPLAMSSEG